MTATTHTKSISEVFLEASRIRTKQGRIDYLRANQSPLMQYMVQGAYHPEVIWLLPRGIPPFKACNQRYDVETVLFQKIGELYIFCLGGNDTLKQDRRKKLFVDILETIHPDDAILLCHVKDKTINYPFMTYSLFKEAFPDWLPEKNEYTWETEYEKNSRAREEELPNPLMGNEVKE